MNLWSWLKPPRPSYFGLPDTKRAYGVAVGSRVRFAERYLKALSTDEENVLRELTGRVVDIDDLGAAIAIAVVQWSDGSEGHYNMKNLRRG